MPCPHNEITIVQRSQRQSAVAAAAYQSGEKLFCEYDQQVKHYPEKRGIVHNEILLPPNAPQEYADRNTLWNAAEAVEKQWNSQLARRWVLTIPREIPPDQYAVLVREFCQKQFVSKGMIADFAIHDPHPPGHNPHAHVLLTMRAMDEHGKWLPKSSKVYDLDENGERIKLPSGRWKSHKEDTVDWNYQEYCEIWRHEWEVIQRYLKEHQRDFMPEDTKAGMIQAYLDKYTGSMVCSKQLYKEALNHAFDEPKQWEIREINEIMNQCIDRWRYFPNPRMFSEYGRQKGWERENPATESGNPSEKTMDGFVEVTEQMELPF